MSAAITRIYVTQSCSQVEPPKNGKKGYRKQHVMVQTGEEVTKVETGFVRDGENFLEIGDYRLGPDCITLGGIERTYNGRTFLNQGFVVDASKLIKLKPEEIRKAA